VVCHNETTKRKGYQVRDTWIGSGVYAVEIEREFTCRSCRWEGEAVGTTDDSNIMLYAECPNCKDEMTIDLALERESARWDEDRENWD